MRKVSLFIVSMAVASSMLFVGCKKDQQFERLGVSIEKATGDSKLYLDDEYNPVFIQSGESINVNGTAYNVEYGSGQYNVTVNCSRPFYAAYPASLTSGFTGTSSQSVTLPRWQKYEKVQVGTDEDGNPVYKQNIKMPAAAAITDRNSTKFYFYNLCSLLEVQWKNTSNKAYQIIGIEVTVPEQAIWGEGRASIDGTSSTLTLNDVKNNRVNLDIAESDRETVAANGGTSNKYYVVLPTFSNKNVTVKIQVMSANASGSGNDADDQKLKTITVSTNETNGVTMHRNYIIPMHIEATPKEDNSLTGYFSVSDNLKVVFSRGNLQHTGTSTHNNGTWKFADRQYDFYGTNNLASSGYIHSTTADLFGWSESSTGSYGLYTYDAWRDRGSWNSSSTFNDWGDKVISGDPAGTWFTLTESEWYYLLYKRVNNNGQKLCGKAKITGVKGHLATSNNIHGDHSSVVYGFILLPDDWSSEDIPSDLTFKSNDEYHDTTVANVYTVSQWALMEAAGAMFLPAAGYGTQYGNESDDGARIENSFKGGQYWSSTPKSGGYAEASYLLYFWQNKEWKIGTSNTTSIPGTYRANYGMEWWHLRSVRLVKPAPGYTISDRQTESSTSSK